MPAHGWPAAGRGVDLDLDWMRDGACVRRADLPWTADGHQLRAAERLAMAAVCSACPVLARCDRFAAQAHVSAGFWAGKARDEAGRAAPVDETTSSAVVAHSDTLGGVA